MNDDKLTETLTCWYEIFGYDALQADLTDLHGRADEDDVAVFIDVLTAIMERWKA